MTASESVSRETLKENNMDAIKMPEEYKGKTKGNCGYTATNPRDWTEKEIEWMKTMKQKGYSNDEIAEGMGRSKTSIAIKLKRLGKSSDTYNKGHIAEKYEMNRRFLDELKPRSILDLYCGAKSFYKSVGGGYEVTTNDIDKGIEADFHEDAFRLICKLYSEGRKFDMIDLDPFGSAYDCFDLAVKMASKGLAITLGELGHKRWKRLDFVGTHYGIKTLEAFTIDNLIEHIRHIGERNKKRLVVWGFKEWQNIGRVYLRIEKLKIVGQWGKPNNEENEDDKLKNNGLSSTEDGGQLELF